MADNKFTDYLAALDDDRHNRGTAGSATAKIRRRVFAGEWIIAGDVAKEVGCTSGLIPIILGEMRTLGFTFASREIGTGRDKRISYQLQNKSHVPSHEQIALMRKKRPKGGKKIRKAAVEMLPPVESNGHGEIATTNGVKRGRKVGKPPLPLLPGIGEELRVFMLVVDEDLGLARIGIRSDKVAWELTVETQRFIRVNGA